MSTYPTLVAEIRELRAAWRRSDDDYREYPIVSCAAWRDTDDGKRIPCPNVAHHNDTMCKGCRREAAARKRGAA